MFQPDNIEVEVEAGENLLRAALAGDVQLNASCGGAGTCGKCRVKVRRGQLEAEAGAKLTEAEIGEGFALACRATVLADAEVEVPEEHLLVQGKPPYERRRRILAQQLRAGRSFEEKLPAFAPDPLARKVLLEMREPTIDDPEADWERVRRELERVGVAPASVELGVLRGLARALRDGGWRATATVVPSDEGGFRLVRMEPGDTSASNFGVAVDLGTTTVVAELLDLAAGRVLAESSDYNGQIRCGEDVISRMVLAAKPGGIETLQSLAASTINGLIKEILEGAGVAGEDVTVATVAGNTTMIHLLLGLAPKHIREAPYVPTADFFPLVRATEAGLDLPNAYLSCLPCVASYVGGDIVAGLVASGVVDSPELTLYIDMGTNGEMALGNSDWLLSCACSAGPAFEGGGIKHGMRAAEGAIELVRVDALTSEPSLLTVGRKRPLGICGSGLIEAAGELFLSGLLDPRGKYESGASSSRVRRGEGASEYVLAWSEDSGTGKEVVLTEIDIDNLLRAKAAIFAGLTSLLESVSLEIGDIQRVFIAGAFGNYLEIDKAVLIGLLPELPGDRFTFVGNGSLLGARLWVLSREARARATDVARKMTYLDLSSYANFMNWYISALFLPHTNLELFPSVKERLAEAAERRSNPQVPQPGLRGN